MRPLVLIGLAVLFSGCQTGQVPVSSSDFMTLWKTYDHCQSSMDLDTMRADVRRLNEEAQISTNATHEPILVLLSPLLITPSSPRLAADPKAMAAACTLYTGQAALTSGHSDLAIEMFSTVIRTYPRSQYGYYVDRAWWGLLDLNEEEERGT